jgi:hypothetical protein
MKHIDITQNLLQSRELAGTWNLERFLAVKNLILTQLAESVIEWDEGSGEGWATVSIRNEVAGYIGFDTPIAVIKSSELANIVRLVATDVTIIEVINWDLPEYIVDLSKVESSFTNWSWTFATDDASKAFAVRDLVISTM